jgi:hypothetical protein
MLKEDIIFYLKVNNKPEDIDFSKFAEQYGYDVKEVELEVCRFAIKYVDFLTNGRSNEKGIKKEDVDKKQLKIGIKIEQEHADDIEIRTKISLDHLAEFDDYYTGLVDMEKRLENK